MWPVNAISIASKIVDLPAPLFPASRLIPRDGTQSNSLRHRKLLIFIREIICPTFQSKGSYHQGCLSTWDKHMPAPIFIGAGMSNLRCIGVFIIVKMIYAPITKKIFILFRSTLNSFTQLTCSYMEYMQFVLVVPTPIWLETKLEPALMTTMEQLPFFLIDIRLDEADFF